MSDSKVRSMEDRKYADIPIDGIKVLNSRTRDKARFQGMSGRYFMIDGNPWCRAIRRLKATAVPNYVIWEETDFFSCLDSLLTVLSKSKQ